MAKRKYPQIDSAVKPQQTKTDTGMVKPDVIVDFIFDNGLLFIAIENIGARPAYKVSTRFNRKFRGAGGVQEISGMALFKNIAFLAPQKKITTFLDTSTAYFRRNEPTDITATIVYSDETGRAYKKAINHDLDIYKDIGYIQKRGGETKANQ